MRKVKGFNNVKAQALMIVISIIALLSVIGVAFYSLAQTERVASIKYLDSLRSRYIAEAGVAYARRVLKLDRQTNLIDSLEDLTFKHFAGQDVDLDADTKPESRWFDITDSEGSPFGRFSIKITDEASKVNLNTTSSEILEQLFSQLGTDGSGVNSLLSRRPFNVIEQIGSILEKKDFAKSKDFLTVYSKDKEIDLERNRRTYLNSSSVQVILEAFLAAGIKNPYQKAANLKDASDSDLAQTRLDEFSRNNIAPTQLLEAGDWQRMGSFYEAPTGSSQPAKFIWSNIPIEDGKYFCFLYGPQDTDVIGQVYLEGEEAQAELLSSGEGFTKEVEVIGGSLTLNIKPAKDKTSRFSHIKLVSITSKRGLVREIITGTEALVINELMVKPSKEISLGNPAEIAPGQSASFTFTQIKPGDYYVVLNAVTTGGLIGDVSIHGQIATNVYDRSYFPSTVNVDSSGQLTVEVKNNSLNTTTFKGIAVIQEPDGEFIEVLNISPSEIDLSNFSFEVYSPQNEPIAGWPARIPGAITIRPYQYLVFAMDNNDSSPAPRQLRGNKISFLKNWGFNGVGLIFDEADTIDKSFDLLPDNGAVLILKDDAGRQIDAVEYKGSGVRDFVSLERADPSSKTDEDTDGLFDGWYLSEAIDLATPTLPNENAGMYTRDENNNKIAHSPSEVVVFNRPLSGLSEVQQLSAGQSWEKFTLSEISLMADHFAYQALELDLAGHYKTGEFVEKDNAFESFHEDDTGIWEFTDIPKGYYLLTILSDNLTAEGEKIQVAYKTNSKEEFKDFSSLLFSQGVAFYGRVECEDGDSLFALKIINDSAEKLVLKKIRLEPVNSTGGRININTATEEVLRSVLSSKGLVQIILENRPIGIKEGRKLGVGELLLLDPGFLSLHNCLTVKSDVYEINCRGEYSPYPSPKALQNIRTVVERGD